MTFNDYEIEIGVGAVALSEPKWNEESKVWRVLANLNDALILAEVNLTVQQNDKKYKIILEPL